jgi:hypothetical protein
VPHKLHSHEKFKGIPGPQYDAVRLSLHFSRNFISRPINLSCIPLHSLTLQPSAPISTTHIESVSLGIMLMPPQQGGPVKSPSDPLVLYSQSLRDYTLRLWMESRKEAEERVRARTHKKHHKSTKALATPSCKVSTGGQNVTSMSNEGSTLLSEGFSA